MTMCATVLCVQNGSLLVCVHCTRQQVLVHTAGTSCFRAGDRACIRYNGTMTNSIPPQISAQHICRICH